MEQEMNHQFGETHNKIITVDIESEMKRSFLDYSMSVIVSRALPDVRDGLKPVHRRILYTMYENGLSPEKAYRKCADTVGAVLGRYHPHGDASVYDALVRLAQDFSMRYPLVDGHGNFGSVDGDPPAAYRYTEAKMSRISTVMLTDIDKDTIDYGSNYDDRLKEPLVLPSRFPNILVNGSTGIAVGMATNIPPHNLGEVIDAVVMLLDKPDATLEDIMAYIPGPDFPTGGIIMGRSGIRAAYGTGRGKITLRGRAEIQEHKNGREKIVITEIPYMVNKARLIENIADLVKDKRITDISDIRDESDREGMRIVVELKRDANAQVVLNQLYNYTQLQDTVGVIMLALHDGRPQVMTLPQILRYYIDFQEEVLTRRTRYDLRKAKEREHILEGMKLVVDHTDEVIHIIRHSEDQNDAKKNLSERFGVTDEQAAAIVAMRLGQLSGMERIKIEEELAQILEKVADLEDILQRPERLRSILKGEILEIRQKYADPRRTEIQTVTGEVDIEDLIPVEDCVITLTHMGYIKRQPADTYRTQRRGGRGISGMNRREEDFVEELFFCSSHDYILFFTDRGRAFRLKGYEIGESGRSSVGTNIVNLLQLESGEQVTAMIRVRPEDEGKYLCMVTEQGVIKRTELAAYKNLRKGGLIAVSLDDGDRLAWVRLTSGEEELIVATREGMAIRFSEGDVRSMGRSARGVRAIKLADGDLVVGMAPAGEGIDILTVSENGQGRRTPSDQYRMQSRGGSGVKNYDTEKNGPVAGIVGITGEDDVILISNDGVIIRIRAEEISTQSRYGGGVRVMRMDEGSRLVSLCRAPREEEAAAEAEAAAEGSIDPAAGEETDEELVEELTEAGFADEAEE